MRDEGCVRRARAGSRAAPPAPRRPAPKPSRALPTYTLRFPNTPPARPQLQTQTAQVQAQAAACAAGGEIEPYNPAWAPWPVHSWPDASQTTCDTMQTHATYIQTSNANTITSLQASMNQAGC